jgi:F420-dependent oxidoreductase-like protein
MKLGLMLGYSGARMALPMDLVKEAESLGYDSVWTAESWGSDAVSPLAWIGAQTSKIRLGTGIMQLPGRSPANTAMTAMTIDQLSGGRMILGLGTSGPQVVEGWHGRPWWRSLTWMREYLTIVRKVFEREAPLTFDGVHYQLPYKGEHSAGLGKPLKSILHGRRDIPIYTGSMAPKGQALSAELADGCLLTCMHPQYPQVITDRLEKGFEKARADGREKSLDTFDIAPTVAVVMGDDLEQCRIPLKMSLALYVGGMGARDKNFYKEYVEQVGFEAECKQIQDLYLDGKRGEAIAAVPDAMVDAFNLVGPADRIRGEFEKWKDAPIGTMLVGTMQPEALRLMAELALS